VVPLYRIKKTDTMDTTNRIVESKIQSLLFLNARVCNITDTTPHLRRISLTHPSLKDVGELNPGAHVKIIIPPEKGNQSVRRTYTIRKLDRVSGMMDIEFVLHGDNGPASAWATNVSINNYLGLGIKQSRKIINWSDWYLFVGDESAIPAITAILESLPEGTPGLAFIEVSSRFGIFQINTKSSVKICWLSREEEPSVHYSKLLKGLEGLEPPDASHYSRYAFIAGEHDMVNTVKKHISQQLGFEREELHATIYWTRGLSEDQQK
jgi:NADPH-dependent ferric siderophore reductase